MEKYFVSCFEEFRELFINKRNFFYGINFDSLISNVIVRIDFKIVSFHKLKGIIFFYKFFFSDKGELVFHLIGSEQKKYIFLIQYFVIFPILKRKIFKMKSFFLFHQFFVEWKKKKKVKNLNYINNSYSKKK